MVQIILLSKQVDPSPISFRKLLNVLFTSKLYLGKGIQQLLILLANLLLTKLVAPVLRLD